MKAPERIVTPRLVLRRPRMNDAGKIFARYASDREVTRLLSWPTHTSVDASCAFITMSDGHWGEFPAGPLLIESRATGQLLGSTGLTFHASGIIETGYLLARDAWGFGYATEALNAVLDLSAAMGLRSIQAHCHTSNAASVRVLEKCGFMRQGLVEKYILLPNLDTAERSDVFVYTIDLAPGRRHRVAVLLSERLLFSVWQPGDVPLAQALWGDPQVTRLIDARGRLDPEQVRERLVAELRTHDEGRIAYWPLFLRETGAFAGCCGLRPYSPAEQMYELGVHLLPRMWGAGLAAEACRAVILHAFRVMGARALFAGHHPDNAPSGRLLRRLGFQYVRDELYPPTGLLHPSYLLVADTAPRHGRS